MKRFIAFGAVVLLGGCGYQNGVTSTASTSTVVVAKPPRLAKVANAETRAPIATAARRCIHYYYVIGPDGHRHRQPCSARVTPEPDNPHPTAGPTVSYTPASGCGKERWAVKTLTDPGANQVNLTPVASSVLDLASIAAPQSPTDRLAPVETTTYRISGRVTVQKQEADSDVHMAISDGQGNTMIVESTSPSCDQGSVVESQIATVRRFVDTHSLVGQQVTVTGVGFFDRIHGQTGVAPNGIELHPLVAIASP